MRVLWLNSGTPFLLHLSPFLFDFHSIRYGRTKKWGPIRIHQKRLEKKLYTSGSAGWFF